MAPTIRKPTAERHREIAEAALRLIGERGIGALTTTALAGEVGLTSGALFRHFESREAILRGAVGYALERIEETFPDGSLPPRERILGLARNRVRLLGRDPGLSWLLRSEDASLSLPADSVGQLRKLVGRSRAFLLEAVRDGARDGTLRSDIDPEDLLVPILGTIHTLVGPPGVHGRVGAHSRSERVLTALARMISPPAKAVRPTAASKSGQGPKRPTNRRKGKP